MQNYFLLLCIFMALSLSAQTTSGVEGIVLEKSTQEPLVGVSVCLYPLYGNDLLSFAISQGDGTFKLKTPVTGDSLRVELSCMGFKKEVRCIGPPFGNSLLIEMVPEAFMLREVRVRAPDISLIGDTVRYLLSGYAQVQDQSIGDVLSRLPGITISTGGQIRYQNEPISHLYIDNKDLMGRGYGIAVSNLPAEAFSMAEVMENHQPVKVLQDQEFSPYAAVNLKLKDAYKSTWMFTADADVGVRPLLWSARLMGAQFAQRWQSMHLYKSNNMGEDLARELLSFGRGPGVFSLELSERQTLFSPANTPPPVQQARGLFNHSHLLATNHLTNLGKDVELRIKASYLYNREEGNRSVTTTYYLPNAPLVAINEIYLNELKTDQLGMELTLKANTKTYYLEDKIEFKGAWNTIQSFLSGTSLLSQHFDLPSLQLNNDFTWIKRTGHRVVKIGSNVVYRQLPQSLSVIAESLTEQMEQNLHFQDVQITLASELQERIGKWNLTFNAGLRVGNQHVTSDLTGFDQTETALPLANNLEALTLEPYIDPGVQFNIKRNLNITFKVPVGYNQVFLKDHIEQTKRLPNQVYLNPSLLMNWSISSLWELRGSYQRLTTFEDILTMHTGYIMRNYRQFDRGLDHLPYRLRNSYSLSLTYRSATGMMGFLRGSYGTGFKNSMTHQELTGIYMFSQLYEAHSLSKLLFITTGITKRFVDIRTSAALNLVYNASSMELVQQNVPVPYQNSSLSINPRLAWNFSKNSQIEYNATLSSNRLVTKDNNLKREPLKQLLHSIRTTLSFSSRWYALMNVEHYANETNPGHFTKGFFGDVGITFHYEEAKYRLDVKNIFNNKYYTRASYSDLSSAEHSWELRPRALCLGASWSF